MSLFYCGSTRREAFERRLPYRQRTAPHWGRAWTLLLVRAGALSEPVQGNPVSVTLDPAAVKANRPARKDDRPPKNAISTTLLADDGEPLATPWLADAVQDQLE